MNRSLYERRRSSLERGISRSGRLHDLGVRTSLAISRARFVVFLVGFVSCLGLYKAAWFHAGNGLLGFFLLVFFSIAYYHNRLEHRLHRLRIWQSIKQSNLGRIQLDWTCLSPTDSSEDSDHPYASDLKIIGPHSLFHLVDTTLSRKGNERLRDWLLHQNEDPLSQSLWDERQNLNKSFTPLPSLRDRMRLETQLVGKEVINGERIRQLVEAAIDFPHLSVILSTSLALCLGTSLGLLWYLINGGPGYWALSMMGYGALYFLFSGKLVPLFGRVQALHLELKKLASVIRVFERRFPHLPPPILNVVEPLFLDTIRPIPMVTSLERVCHGLSIKGHPLIHLMVNICVPWDFLFVFRLRKLCEQLRSTLPVWLDRLATLEAAGSLAGFAWANPHYCWPVLHCAGEGGHSMGVEAKGLGHPLIPHVQRVANDFRLSGKGTVLLVTGSNMSGKSTFLRTVGINQCLAQAGAPVCAESFHASWHRLFCCIQIHDSLEDGISYFYAEVKRLKNLLNVVNLLQHPPLLFLVDEIFRGTNNRERLLGSESFIRELTKGNGLGMVTTHDLELAQLEQELTTVINIHFEESVEGNALRFDYQLRPGPCPTTNALRIMALEGLPVPDWVQEKGSGG